MALFYGWLFSTMLQYFWLFRYFCFRKLSDGDQQNRELISVISKKEESLYQVQVCVTFFRGFVCVDKGLGAFLGGGFLRPVRLTSERTQPFKHKPTWLDPWLHWKNYLHPSDSFVSVQPPEYSESVSCNQKQRSAWETIRILTGLSSYRSNVINTL